MRSLYPSKVLKLKPITSLAIPVSIRQDNSTEVLVVGDGTLKPLQNYSVNGHTVTTSYHFYLPVVLSSKNYAPPIATKEDSSIKIVCQDFPSFEKSLLQLPTVEPTDSTVQVTEVERKKRLNKLKKENKKRAKERIRMSMDRQGFRQLRYATTEEVSTLPLIIQKSFEKYKDIVWIKWNPTAKSFQKRMIGNLNLYINIVYRAWYPSNNLI